MPRRPFRISAISLAVPLAGGLLLTAGCGSPQPAGADRAAPSVLVGPSSTRTTGGATGATPTTTPTTSSTRSVSPTPSVSASAERSRPRCDNARSGTAVDVAPGGAVQAAIDRVAAAGGGCVNLAPGTWTLSQSLRMTSGVTLNGSGTSTLLQGPQAVYDYPLIADSGKEPLENMTVENLVLDGRIPASARTEERDAKNPYGNALGILFDAYTASHRNIVIKNVEVRHTAMGIHVKGTTGLTLSGVDVHDNGIAYWLHNAYLRRCSDVTISNSKFDDSWIGTGLHIAAGGENIVISGSQFSGNDSSGMNVQDLPKNVTIRDSRIVGNNGDGISIDADNLRITGNRVQDNTGTGIHTWAGSGQVEGNTATGNQKTDFDIHGQFTTGSNTSG